MCDNVPHAELIEYQRRYGTSLHDHFVTVDGVRRRFLLYRPEYQQEQGNGVWLLAPGTVSPAEQIMAISGVHALAKKHGFALLVLEGQDCTFNVQRRSQQLLDKPNDIQYTMRALRATAKVVHLDMASVNCVGYSNGARFCCRLASELSNLITGIGCISGVRYPSPNNASLPIPAIAFHGTKDPINPYWGHGNPTYWYTSVPDALQSWASFNGCKAKMHKTVHDQVSLERYYDCDRGADVVLMRLEGGGHTWPGTAYPFNSGFGEVVDFGASDYIRRFFDDHPRTGCHTATVGEACYYAVSWAKQVGWKLRPHWYGGLTNESSFEEFQQVMHTSIRANCPRPCPRVVASDSTIVGSDKLAAAAAAVHRGPHSRHVVDDALQGPWTALVGGGAVVGVMLATLLLVACCARQVKGFGKDDTVCERDQDTRTLLNRRKPARVSTP